MNSTSPSVRELLLDATRLDAFVQRFLDAKLPDARWTHEAHLVVALWLLERIDPPQVLQRLRGAIRAHNEAAGKKNDDTSGYHESITVAYVLALAHYREHHSHLRPPQIYAQLLDSPVAARDYLLRFYSSDALASLQARRTWVEPVLERPEWLTTDTRWVTEA